MSLTALSLELVNLSQNLCSCLGLSVSAGKDRNESVFPRQMGYYLPEEALGLGWEPVDLGRRPSSVVGHGEVLQQGCGLQLPLHMRILQLLS